MTNQELINKLQNFQDWRRGKHDDMPHPKDIGEWIDEAIARLNIKTWRDHSKQFAKGETPPRTIESLQAAWERDQELIFEQLSEINKLKQKVNQLMQKHYTKGSQ